MATLGSLVYYHDSVGKHLAVVVYSGKVVDSKDKEHEDTSVFVYDYGRVIQGVQSNDDDTPSHGYSPLKDSPKQLSKIDK
jgi:hypothetical protein